MLSTNNVHHGTSSWMCLVGSSITESDRYGLKADPWSKPIIIEKALVSPSMVLGYVFNCVYVYSV